MKPTSFLFDDTRTPQCHWGSQPGGRRALGGDTRGSAPCGRLAVKDPGRKAEPGSSPFEKVWRIVESEHVVVVLHVVLVQ